MAAKADTPAIMAIKAMELYSNRDYDPSLRLLKKISKQKDGEDLKVAHNIALTEYQIGGCKNQKTLLDSLEKLNQELDAIPKEEEADEAYQEDFNISILRYNQAVLSFQLKQFNSAIEILEDLYVNLGSLDDHLTLKVCFLLLDLYISQKCTSKAQEVLTFLMDPVTYKQFFKKDAPSGSQPSSPSGRPQESPAPPPAVDVSPSPSSSNATSGSESASMRKAAASPLPPSLSPIRFKFALHLYKTRVHLLNHNLKQAKKEIKSALQLYQREAKAATAAQDNQANEDSNSGQGDKGSKDNSNSPNSEGGLDASHSSSALFLKSNLEYMRANYRKAIKLLNSCQMQANSGAASGSSSFPSQALYFNNLGCIHYSMKKYCTAGFLLNKALRFNLRIGRGAQGQAQKKLEDKKGHSGRSGNSNHSLDTFPSDSRTEILYNCGLQQLVTNKPDLAFSCFQESSLLCYNRPSLWLRMAECCVALHVRKLAEVRKGNKNALVTRELGSANSRRLILTPSVAALLDANQNQGEKGSGDAGPGNDRKAKGKGKGTKTIVPSLTYATKCLRNCLSLLALRNKEEDVRHLHMKQVCLLNTSFVSLCLNDPMVALRYCTILLEMKDITPTNKFLCRNYAAEALCLLNRVEEALSHLDPSTYDEANLQDTSEVARSPYQAHVGASPRCALYVNLATVYIVKGNLEQAKQSVNVALRTNPTYTPALRTLAYLELRQGHTALALHILKERRPLPFRDTHSGTVPPGVGGSVQASAIGSRNGQHWNGNERKRGHGEGDDSDDDDDLMASTLKPSALDGYRNTKK